MAISLPVADPTIQPTVNPILSSPDILGEIDRAHASLSQPAQDAIEHAHGLLGLQAPGTPPAAPEAPFQGIKPPVSSPLQEPPPDLGTPRGTVQGIGLPPKPGLRGLTPPPAVPTTNEARLQHLQDTGSGVSQIRSPWARIPLQILDAVGRGITPGIEMGLPGTSGHHDVLVHQAGQAVKQDEETQEKKDAALTAPVNRDHLEAETGELGARAAHENAEATAAAKPTNEWMQLSEPVTDPAHPEIGPQPAFFNKNDPSKGLAYGNAPVAARPTENKPKTEHVVLPDGSVVAITTDPKGETIAKQVYKGDPRVESELSKVKVGGKLHEVLVNKATGETIRDLGETTEANSQDHGQNVFDKSGKMIRLEPGQTAPEGAVTAAGMNTSNTPTTQQRNVGAQAQLVHEQTPHMLSEIDRLKDKLGPVSGRWNEFMQGKIGTEDPDMAGLRSDLLMYSSAVALMHARGRLPENLREEFDNAINAPKQSPENLKAIINRIDGWTAQNMKAMQAGGGGPVNELPGGVTLQDIDAELAKRKKAGAK